MNTTIFLGYHTRGILLCGPPGTGKTMLARALACTTGATFFNIHASSMASKWRGDSEKLVRHVFELAAANAPSIVFLDEAEALLGDRGMSSEHEASKRYVKKQIISESYTKSCNL